MGTEWATAVRGKVAEHEGSETGRFPGGRWWVREDRATHEDVILLVAPAPEDWWACGGHEGEWRMAAWQEDRTDFYEGTRAQRIGHAVERFLDAGRAIARAHHHRSTLTRAQSAPARGLTGKGSFPPTGP